MGAQESKPKEASMKISKKKEKLYGHEAKMRLGSFKRGTNKKRDSISPPSNESTNSANTPIRKLNNNDESISTANRGTPNRNSDLQNGNVPRTPSSTGLAGMKTPSIRKTPTPRRNESIGPNLHRTASVPLKDSNHNGIVSKSGSAVTITNNNNKVKSAQVFQSKPLKTTPTTKGSATVQVKNGCLLAVQKETNKALLKQLKHNCKAFETFAILLSYCANDLDAFSTPYLKQKLENKKNKLTQAQSDLEDLQSRLSQVQVELNDKELAITTLQSDKLSLKNENENLKKLVEDFEGKLNVISEQKREAESELLKECNRNRCLRRELSDKTEKYESEKENLMCCLSEAKKEIRDIKEEYEKCLSENQRLVEVVSAKEKEAEEKEAEKKAAESEESTRQRRGESKERCSDVPTTPLLEKSHWNFSNASSNPKCLESEVESLRQVLALKTDEVTELRRQEMSLRENADRVPKLVSTITMLEGKVEDLQTQLSSQTETVRDLFKSSEHLKEELKSVSNQKTRLAQKNEELQYKLKEYAGAMRQLVNQTYFSECNVGAEFHPSKPNSRRNNASVNSQMKGVVEKSDSMSYMLQMTEDSSEIVTNIIRRAGSLRLPSREHTLPKKKRVKASSVSSSDVLSTKDDFAGNFSPSVTSTPNSSPNHYSSSPSSKSTPKKTVKLSQGDFSTNSIELSCDNDCEVIEITKSFDKADHKNGEMVTSTSSSSSSSSNGSHFDLESDVFSNLDNDQNIHDSDEDFGDGVPEMQNVRPILPVYTDLEPSEDHSAVAVGDRNHVQSSFLASTKSFVKIPKVSGGEAMIAQSSDEDI